MMIRILLLLLLLIGCGPKAPRPELLEGENLDLLGHPFQPLVLDGRGRLELAPPPSLLPLLDRARLEGPLTSIAEGDSLMALATGQAGGRWIFELPLLDPAQMVALRFQYAGTSDGHVRIALRREGEDELVPLPGWVVVRGGDRWQDCVYPMRRHLLADGRPIELALLPPQDEVGTVGLRDLRLEIAAGANATQLSIAGRTRRCLALDADHAARWRVRIHPEARLSFGYAVRERAWTGPGDGSYFELRVDDEPVWSDYLAPKVNPRHQDWSHARVDLSRWAGREVELTLLAHASPPARGPFRARDDDRDDAPVFSAPRLHRATASGPNVLLLVVDTLRRDGLGSHGNLRDASPRLDALAEESVIFRNAWATAPWTHPSTASLLSGRLPSRHGLGTGPLGTTEFLPDAVLLAEELKRAGYATGAVSNNIIVSPEQGFAWGTDSFDTRPFPNDNLHGARRVTEAALDWLEEEREGPFFLYLHYFDPHTPYQAPAPFTRMFVDEALEAQAGADGVRRGSANLIRERLDDPDLGYVVDPAQIAYLRALYDGEVRYADHWIGRLLDRMEAWGLLENTTLIVTADHGEEFLDHGFLKHGQSLYDELIGVPLLWRPPGGGGGERRAAVSLADVAPTLLDLLGIEPGEGWQVQGRSFRPLLERDEPPAPPAIFAERFGYHAGRHRGPQRAVIELPYKSIRYLEEGRDELFDLQHDPLELNDLDAEKPEITATLQAEADSVLAEAAENLPKDAPMNPALLEKLKALGYVH